MVKDVRVGYHEIIPNCPVNYYYTRESNGHRMRLIRVGSDPAYWLLCDLDNGSKYVTQKHFEKPEHAMREYD